MSNLNVISCNDNDSIRCVSFDNEKGVETRALVDRFGNILTPFFTKVFDIIEMGRDRVLIFFKKDNEKVLYSVMCGVDSDNSVGFAVNFPYALESVKKASDNTLIFETMNGSCFVDSDNFSRVSNFYDSIHYDDACKSFIYELKVYGDEDETTLVGPISLDGVVANEAYDTSFGIIRSISYDDSVSGVIDTKKIVDELNERSLKNQNKKLMKVRQIAKKCK